jgi:hypothetical protein
MTLTRLGVSVKEGGLAATLIVAARPFRNGAAGSSGSLNLGAPALADVDEVASLVFGFLDFASASDGSPARFFCACIAFGGAAATVGTVEPEIRAERRSDIFKTVAVNMN